MANWTWQGNQYGTYVNFVSVKTSFDPDSGDLANAIGEAIIGKGLSAGRIKSIISRCYRIALMSAGKLLRQSLQAAMRGETIPLAPRTRWRGQWDITTVLRSIRPLRRARKTAKGRASQALKVIALGYGRTPLPLFGRLQQALEYKFNERSGWLRVGFLRDRGSAFMQALQKGFKISGGNIDQSPMSVATRRWYGTSESMRRYWGALGMPIPRSRTEFEVKPRPIVGPVFDASNIQNHLEQRFIRALQEKLS